MNGSQQKQKSSNLAHFKSQHLPKTFVGPYLPIDANGQRNISKAQQVKPNIQQVRDDTIARMVLAGTRAVTTAKAPTAPAMPSLAWKLNNQQTADILTYVRNTWGNAAPAVSPETVERIRGELHGGR